jgi:hypothetical protein
MINQDKPWSQAISAWQFWQAQGQEHHGTRKPQLRRGGDFGKDQILEDVGGPWDFFSKHL